MTTPVIFCVDDNYSILKTLGEQLHRHFGRNYSIELTTCGKEAIQLCSQLTKQGVMIPLIISDYKMPGISGDLLLVQLHRLYPHTLKFMLTGHPNLAAVAKMVNASALHRYLAKPWQEAELISKVSEALDQYEALHLQRLRLHSLKAPIQKRLAQLQISEDIS